MVGILNRFIGDKPREREDVDGFDEDGKEIEVDDSHKFTFTQACALNTMMMFGTGPFVSMPYCIASTDPPGPHAMIGYSIAALACFCDSWIWGELGSRFPYSGGTYVYLRECFGVGKWGDLAAFIFLWQSWISGPANCASGFIAIANYASYIHGNNDYWTLSFTAFCLNWVVMAILMQKPGNSGRMIYVLWAVTIAAILYVLIAGFVNFDGDNFQLPPEPLRNGIATLGAACRFGIYDFTGYYDVCTMGGEVQKPRRTIPGSCIITCSVLLCVYMLTYISILGYLPWGGDDGFATRAANDDAVYIVAEVPSLRPNPALHPRLAQRTPTALAHSPRTLTLSHSLARLRFGVSQFSEKLAGRAFACFSAVIVCIVIFGSVFSNMAGMMYLPGAAAESGLFIEAFARRSTLGCSEGVPTLSLLALGTLSSLFCFLDLDVVVGAMTVMLTLVQFIGQGVGICALRYQIWAGRREDDPKAWKVRFLPLVVIPQLIIFSFIFVTTDSYFRDGSDPLLELSILYIFIGIVFFMGRQKYRNLWPFTKEEDLSQVTFSTTADTVNTVALRFAETQAKHREALLRAARVELLRRQATRRIMNADLARGWAAWFHMWTHGQNYRRLLQKVASRVKKPELNEAFAHWLTDWKVMAKRAEKAELWKRRQLEAATAQAAENVVKRVQERRDSRERDEAWYGSSDDEGAYRGRRSERATPSDGGRTPASGARTPASGSRTPNSSFLPPPIAWHRHWSERSPSHSFQRKHERQMRRDREKEAATRQRTAPVQSVVD